MAVTFTSCINFMNKNTQSDRQLIKAASSFHLSDCGGDEKKKRCRIAPKSMFHKPFKLKSKYMLNQSSIWKVDVKKLTSFWGEKNIFFIQNFFFHIKSQAFISKL